LFGLINDLSFLNILSLVSITTPGIGQAIQAQILKFIYFDMLMTDKWFNQLFYGKKNLKTDEETDYALNYYFDFNGFESMSLVKNLGSTFIYLLI
jgi:hypothetical protein